MRASKLGSQASQMGSGFSRHHKYKPMKPGEKKSENRSERFQTVCTQCIAWGWLAPFRRFLRIPATLEMTIADGLRWERAGRAVTADYDFYYDFFINRKWLAG